MANEFNIKNGFISNENSRIIGGLTANTISATTYQNLPATPFLPLSGGTLLGDLIVNGSGNRLFTVSSGAAGGVEMRLLPNSTGGYTRINVGNTNAPLDFQMNSATVMTLTQAGNVGIGATPSSGTTLLVNGSVSATTYNLKTINTFSLVGSGDISISGGVAYTRQNANNSTNDSINYCGIALGTGVTTSAAAWTITRITVAVEGSVTTAVSAPNSIWNNRESISYT
jgi:hypothetical protein